LIPFFLTSFTFFRINNNINAIQKRAKAQIVFFPFASDLKFSSVFISFGFRYIIFDLSSIE